MNTQKENENIRKKSLRLKFKLFLKRATRNNDFFHNHIALWLLSLNLILNVANWIILIVFINRVDGGIILHYNVYFGVDDIGNWKQAFILPAIGILLFSLNAFLASYFYKNKERIASYVLLIASSMAQINLIIASISVIMINY
jgi:hypothetical protein